MSSAGRKASPELGSGKSLVEDMARAIAASAPNEQWAVMPERDRGYFRLAALVALTVLKDRLPADDRELVERLQTVGKSGLTVRGQECAGDTMLRAADRIIALSASRDTAGDEDWEQWMRDQESRARSESKS